MSGRGRKPGIGPVIVDASVAMKWFIPEAGSAQARVLLAGDQKLIAPGQIRTEVAGGLLRRFRENLLEERPARQACSEWLSILGDGFVEVTENTDLLKPAIDTAFDVRHALPDCLYLTLAKQTGGTLVTFDQKLHQRGESICRVQLMSCDD